MYYIWFSIMGLYFIFRVRYNNYTGDWGTFSIWSLQIFEGQTQYRRNQEETKVALSWDVQRKGTEEGWDPKLKVWG